MLLLGTFYLLVMFLGVMGRNLVMQVEEVSPCSLE